MKIGLIVPGFSSDEQDWCIPALLDLARWLAVSNQVQVLALRYPPRHSVYRVAGVPVHSFGGATRSGSASIRLWAAVIATLAREHRKARFEVLHAVYGGEAGWVTVLAAKLLRVPAVVSFVGGELVGLADIRYGAELQPRQRLMNHLTLRLADAVLAGSEQLTQSARAHVSPARRARVQTLPLGVDTQLFSPGHSSVRAGVNILSVGSLIPVKDHQTLLHAMAQLVQVLPDARLTLVGTGPLRDSLGQLAAQLEIGEQVNFVGAVRHEELPEWYRRADLYVQSSRHEGEGMAVLEAAACGVPLAGTAVGVLADLAARGAAVAVSPNDAAALARAMQHTLAARSSLGPRGRELIQHDYDLQRIGEQLSKLYCALQKDGALNVTQSFSRT